MHARLIAGGLLWMLLLLRGFPALRNPCTSQGSIIYLTFLSVSMPVATSRTMCRFGHGSASSCFSSTEGRQVKSIRWLQIIPRRMHVHSIHMALGS